MLIKILNFVYVSSAGSTVVKPTPPTIIRLTPGNDPFETQTKVSREFPQTGSNTFKGQLTQKPVLGFRLVHL